MLRHSLIMTVLVGLAGPGLAQFDNSRLRLAEQYMADHADRYLHQSKLARGMTGYGLTVLAGTKIEKFNVQVISVLHKYGPQQDVVLCRLSGLELEKTGLIKGMSGSPIFIKDPADGKEKLIGAVAYGWAMQKEPLCGVQPIVQMLAVSGAPIGGDVAAGAARAPSSRPTSQPASQPATHPSAGGVSASALDEQLVKLALDPRKLDFANLGQARQKPLEAAGESAAASPALSALGAPVMIAGGGEQTVALAQRALTGSTLLPLRSGAVAAAELEANQDVKLAPGSAVAVQLISGDADWAACGTITDVIGDYVLAFGHAFQSKGACALPMGTAYIHTTVPSMQSSFKLSSTLKIIGTLTDDELTGIGGRIGQTAPTVPMTIKLCWPEVCRKYSYRLIRHNWLTPVLASLILKDSMFASQELPELHWLDYKVTIEFDKLGTYSAVNRSCGTDVMAVASDVTRPLAAIMNTTLGEPVWVKSIDVQVTVQPLRKTADVLLLELDRNSYKPGETVKGKATLRPFRAEPVQQDISFELPADLPDGPYVLTASDGLTATLALQQEMPQRFAPRTLQQLFESIQQVVEVKTDSLYLRLPLREAGLAVKWQELDSIPPSMAQMLLAAEPVDTKAFRRSKVQELPAGYVLDGSAQAQFVVEKQPRREN